PPWKIIGRQSTDVIAVEDKVVGRALHIIREEAAHDLSVGRLSDRLKISRRSLELRFRRALNRAPYDEILRVRLAHAQSLLAETDLDVSQVAEAAGFHDTRRLSLLFRQKLGLTPSDYRRQRRL
ncbi:MAG: helix-turn-helix domain-containing protein, partial [Puniceicoccaceae bacterium]